MGALIVHLLVGGRAACGLPGAPATWPEGERWTGPLEPDKVTCSACQAEAARVLADPGAALGPVLAAAARRIAEGVAELGTPETLRLLADGARRMNRNAILGRIERAQRLLEAASRELLGAKVTDAPPDVAFVQASPLLGDAARTLAEAARIAYKQTTEDIRTGRLKPPGG